MINVTLPSGHLMPIIGLGTWELRGADMIHRVIDAALGAGYRAFDTAEMYENEKDMGDAFKKILPKYNLTRKDIFITSKLDPSKQGCEKARNAFFATLGYLQTDYLDLYLIHYPGTLGIEGNDPLNKVNRKQSWLELEKLFREGKIRDIGVSNYMAKHLEDLLSYCTIKPAVNQCEHNPHCKQTDAREYCRKHDIIYGAFSSFGSALAKGTVLNDETVVKIAEAHKRTTAQVLLRWAVQDNIIVIPRSSNPERIKSNINIFDFELSQGEIQALNSIDTFARYDWNPNTVA